MRVFVTGASGHIGSAVIPELLGAGHEVVGLARSDKSALTLTAAGAKVQRGDLDDLGSLRESCAAADGVIHLAFKHEAMRAGDMAAAVEADLRAVEAMGGVLAGTGKPLVTASGTLLLALAGLGRAGTEADVLQGGPRIDAENAVVAFAERGVRSSVVRLPPTVHSSLDHHGFVPTLIAIARSKGSSAYVADGSSRWPAGHTLDVARLFRLALEAAQARGCTPSAMRASRSVRSPALSAATWTCRWSASRRRTQTRSSASSALSSSSTTRPRARGPRSSSAGGRRIPASSRISTRATISRSRPGPDSITARPEPGKCGTILDWQPDVRSVRPSSQVKQRAGVTACCSPSRRQQCLQRQRPAALGWLSIGRRAELTFRPGRRCRSGGRT